MKKQAELVNEEDIKTELRNIGVHPYSVKIFIDKAKFRRIKLYGIRNAIANILKQEALSVGADVAVNQGCVNCTLPSSDVLIMGNIAQLKKLVKKMKINVAESPSVAKQIEKLIK